MPAENQLYDHGVLANDTRYFYDQGSTSATQPGSPQHAFVVDGSRRNLTQTDRWLAALHGFLSTGHILIRQCRIVSGCQRQYHYIYLRRVRQFVSHANKPSGQPGGLRLMGMQLRAAGNDHGYWRRNYSL